MTAQGDTLVPLPVVRQMAGGLSESSIRRRVEDGSFPSPIVLSWRSNGQPARVAWSEREIRSWAAAKVAAARRSGPEAAA